MKKTAFAFLLVFMTISISLPAQMDRLRLGITVQPLPLLEFYQGGNLRLGLQSRIAPRFFLHGEFGKYLDFLNYNTSELKGYNWRAALQYNYSSFFYLSLDYFYKDHAFNLTDEIEINGNVYEKTYRLQKYANSIGVKWGRMFWSRNSNTYSDLYFGLGLRMREVRQTGLTPAEVQGITSTSFVYQAARKEGRIFSPDFAFGFRLGFGLLKKE